MLTMTTSSMRRARYTDNVMCKMMTRCPRKIYARGYGAAYPECFGVVDAGVNVLACARWLRKSARSIA
jgi:hypothetical protein